MNRRDAIHENDLFPARDLLPEEGPSVSNEIIEAPAREVSMFERLALDPSVDVDKLERLIQMKERIDRTNAETAYGDSMVSAQAEMRPISADATNPQTRSRYATYSKLDAALRPIYTRHGFAISYDTDDCPLPDHVRVIAKVRHRLGHKDTHHVDMPADGKGAKGGDVMTKTHASGAAYSYGMRYLLKMIFNVAVGEDDDDGNRAGRSAATPSGYDDWIDDLRVVAENGTAALEKTWKDSRADLRKYALKHDVGTWNSIKAAAAKVKA